MVMISGIQKISKFFFLTALIASVTSCILDKKIPVTTNSKEALKYYKIGLNYADKLLIHEARNNFETAVVLDSTLALGYLGLATSSPDVKGFFENITKAKALIDKISEGEKLWILGVDAGSNGQQQKQNEYYLELAEKYPYDERAHSLLGQNYYFGLQQYEKSISSYKKAIEINPKFSPPYNIIGYAFRTLERYNEAEKAFKQYIKLLPNDANPYDSYAELLLKTGKHEESIKYYKKALAVDPTFQNSYSGIAANLIILGRYEDARDRLQIPIDKALNTGNKRIAHYGIALSYIDEGNLNMAINSINSMIEIDERIADTTSMAADYNIKGLIFLGFGKYNLALEQFKLSHDLILNSHLNQQIKDNGEITFAYNRFSVAIARQEIDSTYYYSDVHQKLAVNMNNPFIDMRSNRIKGMISLARKDYNNALLYFEKTNQQNPQNIYHMAESYEGLAKNSSAKELYKKAAHFNILNDFNFWIIRQKALKKYSAL